MRLSDVQTAGGQLLRLRFQLAGVIASAAIPLVIALAVGSPSTFDLKLYVATSLYGVLAGGLGVLLLRSVSNYPGVEASSYTLPAFAISYGVLLSILILARLPYSRLLLFANFLIVLTWFFTVHVVSSRRRSLTIGIVPGGDHDMLVSIGAVDWIIFDEEIQTAPTVDAVTADLRIDLPPEWDRRLADFALEGVPVYHTKHLVESLTGRVQLEHLSENSFGTLAPVSAFMRLKHLGDWIAAAVSVVVLAPIMLMIALIIIIDTSGPAIFRQTRIGYRGKPFTVFKFRTMTVANDGASQLDAAKTKSADARITRVGSFLRRSRIDELPQIFNILRGEMSWIGPRPEAQVLSAWYENEIPFYRYRHIVRPGLTGWAQVNQGHVAEVEDVKEKLYYDFYYIKNYSPWIDMLIIGKTIQTVITGFGAR